MLHCSLLWNTVVPGLGMTYKASEQRALGGLLHVYKLQSAQSPWAVNAGTVVAIHFPCSVGWCTVKQPQRLQAPALVSMDCCPTCEELSLWCHKQSRQMRMVNRKPSPCQVVNEYKDCLFCHCLAIPLDAAMWRKLLKPCGCLPALADCSFSSADGSVA